jgi:hypothetical protein
MHVKCYVTLACTTHIGECVSIVETHWAKHGGRALVILGFDKDISKYFSTPLIQHRMAN